ncbi:hypothetical protein BASA81_006756 [Batrachochytrium salamandrivorans]|nr:hypothetical protein BASA81_006756 [Batrachochytrium salamandrivorans]
MEHEGNLYAKIHDPAHVAEAVAAMGNPNCGYKEIQLYDFSPPLATGPSRFNPLPLTTPLTASFRNCLLDDRSAPLRVDGSGASKHPTTAVTLTSTNLPGNSSRECAKQQVGEKGNQAVRDHIARALENCRVKNVHIEFRYCNLDQASVQLLANAVEKNTCIGGFACEQNPFNYP